MKTLITIVAAIVLGGLAGAAALFIPSMQQGKAPSDSFQPVWTETKWPFPMDQWGIGKAFTCKAADCGAELTVYVRAKVGFCNCTTGVADDEELERVGDVDLVDTRHTALGPGEPISVAWMKGRSRPYALALPAGTARSALAVAFNDRCDVIVATAFVAHHSPAAWQPAVIAFLNSDRVLRWAEKAIGL